MTNKAVLKKTSNSKKIKDFLIMGFYHNMGGGLNLELMILRSTQMKSECYYILTKKERESDQQGPITKDEQQ